MSISIHFRALLNCIIMGLAQSHTWLGESEQSIKNVLHVNLVDSIQKADMYLSQSNNIIFIVQNLFSAILWILLILAP